MRASTFAACRRISILYAKLSSGLLPRYEIAVVRGLVKGTNVRQLLRLFDKSCVRRDWEHGFGPFPASVHDVADAYVPGGLLYGSRRHAPILAIVCPPINRTKPSPILRRRQRLDRRGIEVGAVRPDERVSHGTELDLSEDPWVSERAIHLARQYAFEVDALVCAIVKLHLNAVGRPQA